MYTFKLIYPLSSFLTSVFLHLCRPVRSYWRHLEERDPIWGNDWPHSLHHKVSQLKIPGLSSAIRKISGNLCTVPELALVSPLSLSDWRDALSIWSLAPWTTGQTDICHMANSVTSYLFMIIYYSPSDLPLIFKLFHQTL